MASLGLIFVIDEAIKQSIKQIALRMLLLCLFSEVILCLIHFLFQFCLKLFITVLSMTFALLMRNIVW